MKCKKHPKYRAIRKPRVNCEACWMMYFINNYFMYGIQHEDFFYKGMPKFASMAEELLGELT